MVVIGITGGLASGKTEVSRMFKRLGAKVLNADIIAHRALYKNTRPYRQVIKLFGQEIVNRDGSINRKKLGRIVFSSKSKQRRLCSIVHPWVFNYIESALQNLRRRKKLKAVVVEAVLLIESGFYKKVDIIVLVKSTVKLQLMRATKKRNIAAEDAKKRMSFQLEFAKKKKYADYIVDNCGALKYTRSQVNNIWESIFQ